MANSADGQANAGSDHPPRPRLTLRVGISGHRPKPERFPHATFDRVRRQLGAVFVKIDEVLNELKDEFAIDPNDRSKGHFYAEDASRAVPHTVRLVSALAEGADQMAVRALPEHWQLDAVLPFPYDSYLGDFKTSATGDGRDVTADFIAAYRRANTVVELPDDIRIARKELTETSHRAEYQQVHNQGYARLGTFLLGQIDILVAVWDGRREDGPGGTAEVVRGAIDAGIPVLWISTVDELPPRMVLEVDDDLHPIAPPADALQGALKAAVTGVVAVPETVEHGAGHPHQGPDAKTRLKDFLNERWPQPTGAVCYDLFRRWIDGKPLRLRIKPAPLDDCLRGWDPFLAAAPPGKRVPRQSAPLPERIRDVLLRRYAWADSIAVERSHWYRSAYIKCYLLAVLLVAVALLGVFAHDMFHREELQLAAKAVLVATELGLVIRIVHIVRTGRRERWLEKWVEYRALAELLRSAHFLAFVGEHGYSQRAQDLEPASSAWFLWYVRATIRELGLPSAVLDPTYQNQVLVALENHVIDDQLDYNESTAASLAHMHHVLHQVGNACFIATGLILGLFVVAYAVHFVGELIGGKVFAAIVGLDHAAPDVHAAGGAHSWSERLGRVLAASKSAVTVLAALLPALGAALFGIRETGDFEGSSRRAQRTTDKLSEIKQALERTKRRLTLDSTTKTLLSTAQVLTEDVGAWQAVYGRKQLNLPA